MAVNKCSHYDCKGLQNATPSWEGLQSARCPECNALIGTFGVDHPPHLPGCKWYAEQSQGMQNVTNSNTSTSK